MPKQTLTKIKAYDHFTTFKPEVEDQATECFILFCGEVIREDDVYLHVASKTNAFNYPSGESVEGEEPFIHKIIKSTIIKRVDAEIEWDEDEEDE